MSLVADSLDMLADACVYPTQTARLAAYRLHRRRPGLAGHAVQELDARDIADALLRSKAWVRSDFNPGIFHRKFIIRDGRSVRTGSTNFTETGVTNNLNHVIIVHDQKVARVYAHEYRDIRRGNFGKQSQAPRKPPELTVIGVRLKVAFAPDHNPEMEIMKQMTKAKQRIDFADDQQLSPVRSASTDGSRSRSICSRSSTMRPTVAAFGRNSTGTKDATRSREDRVPWQTRRVPPV